MDAVSEDRLDRVQAYYDNLADRLVAVESRNWHLQSRMALNLETIDRFVRAREPRVLDVGCGTGFLLEQLAGRGFHGIGVDLSPESVEHANRRLAEIGAADRLTAMVGSAYEPPEGPFDLIALTDVLEHLEDPRRCLAALRAQLAPDGLLVISTPNRRSLPGARRWLAERGVPGIRLHLAPIDQWQTWTDLEGHAASAGHRRAPGRLRRLGVEITSRPSGASCARSAARQRRGSSRCSRTSVRAMRSNGPSGGS